VSVPSPERFTLQFSEDGRLTMRADCNTCVGSYQMSATELRAGALACTRAFCGSESLDQEFLRVFDGAAAIVALNDALIISRDGTRLTFRH
jgi:heat shock protein HslJ